MQAQVHVLGEPLLPRMVPFLIDFEGWIQQQSPSCGTQKGHWQDSRDNSRRRGERCHSQGQGFGVEAEGWDATPPRRQFSH